MDENEGKTQFVVIARYADGKKSEKRHDIMSNK